MGLWILKKPKIIKGAGISSLFGEGLDTQDPLHIQTKGSNRTEVGKRWVNRIVN